MATKLSDLIRSRDTDFLTLNLLDADNNLSDVANAAISLTNLGVTATASELNILDEVTATTAELNYLDIISIGTVEPLKAVTADANGDIISIGDITANNFIDSVGQIRAIPQSGSAKTTDYSLQPSDVGQFIEIGSNGSITIPDATFSSGDAVVLFNNTSANATITCSITTAYIAGDGANVASVTLTNYGVCNILFISGTTCVITGNIE